MRGKSVCVVNDLTLQEQKHLYEVASVVKKQILSGVLPEVTTQCCSYLMFLEDSTRTKESFRNAAETLKFRTNLFDATSSSLNKFETLNDTVRMLCGYTAMPTVFVIRSRIEGLCQSLHDAMGEYSARSGVHRPSFVNAGDGKHEHPTQEFLDEFSFIQQLGGKTDRIHIALVGDLLLGRTVHSKADGLRIFGEVIVDVVAPKELQLPQEYLSKMKANGFKINIFASLDDYLSSNNSVASILYFTRLQLERMDKSMLEKEKELRKATTLRIDMLSKLPKGAKIYHPLPRHGEMPEIPFEVDKTEFNGYDEQSRNGYYVRTALLGLLTGVYEDIPTSSLESVSKDELNIVPQKAVSINPFFERVASLSQEPVAWVEVEFPAGTCPSKVRKAISRLRVLSEIETKDGFCQIAGSCGVHSVPFSLALDGNWQSFFFTFFHGLQPRIFVEYQKGEFTVLKGEGRVQEIKEVPGVRCNNVACVSHPDSKQRDVPVVFHPSRLDDSKFVCRYCEREQTGLELFL